MSLERHACAAAPHREAGTAEVDKMIRWGAVVADADKAKMVLYLSKNFGPETKFTPTRVRP